MGKSPTYKKLLKGSSEHLKICLRMLCQTTKYSQVFLIPFFVIITSGTVIMFSCLFPTTYQYFI